MAALVGDADVFASLFEDPLVEDGDSMAGRHAELGPIPIQADEEPDEAISSATPPSSPFCDELPLEPLAKVARTEACATASSSPLRVKRESVEEIGDDAIAAWVKPFHTRDCPGGAALHPTALKDLQRNMLAENFERMDLFSKGNEALDMKANVLEKIRNGIDVYSECSGVLTAEDGCDGVREELLREGEDLGEDFRAMRCGDIARTTDICHDLYTGKLKSDCQMTDITKRMPLELKDSIVAIQAAADAEFETLVTECGMSSRDADDKVTKEVAQSAADVVHDYMDKVGTDAMAACRCHSKNCPMFPSRHSEHKHKHKQSRMRLFVAGRDSSFLFLTVASHVRVRSVLLPHPPTRQNDTIIPPHRQSGYDPPGCRFRATVQQFQ
jgi:hypothetical protein